MLRKIAALGVLLGLLLAACGGPVTPPVQTSPADIARQAPAPIQISPRIAKIYGQDYLGQLTGDVSGVFALSPNGNRFEYRFCKHPDCLLSDDELASRAIARCSIGADPGQACLVFDRNGRTQQPYRTWSDSDFDMPVPNPPLLSITDPKMLADPTHFGDRYVVMTPEGQLAINLNDSGRAYFWDTGDNFHQGTWSLKDGGVCVDSVDGRSTVACGKLYGSDPEHITGATLDLFPGKYLAVTRSLIVVRPRKPATSE